MTKYAKGDGANDWFVVIEQSLEDGIYAGPFRTKAAGQLWHIERVGMRQVDGNLPYKIIRFPELAGPARELHAKALEKAKVDGLKPEDLDSVILLYSKKTKEAGKVGPEISPAELREVSASFEQTVRPPASHVRTERPEGERLTRDREFIKPTGGLIRPLTYVANSPADNDDKWGTWVLVILILMAVAGALLGLGHGLSQ